MFTQGSVRSGMHYSLRAQSLFQSCLIYLVHVCSVTTEKSELIAIRGTVSQYPTVAIFKTQMSLVITGD